MRVRAPRDPQTSPPLPPKEEIGIKFISKKERGGNILNIRLVQFSLGPGKRSVAEAIADKVVPVIRMRKGCERCEFYADDGAGDYGIVVLWASKQAADAASSVISPILMPALAEAKATPIIRLFDVYQPKV